jgi:hypothetical protein
MAAIAPGFCRRAEIAFQHDFTGAFGDVQLIVVGIEQFDAVLRAFGERHAVPDLFVRAVLARLGLASPARHFELGPARPQARVEQSIFDGMHGTSPRNAKLENRLIRAAMRPQFIPHRPGVLTPQPSVGSRRWRFSAMKLLKPAFF